MKTMELNHRMGRPPKGDNSTARAKGFLNHVINGCRLATAGPEEETIVLVLDVRKLRREADTGPGP